jgi:hypothetical protein
VPTTSAKIKIKLQTAGENDGTWGDAELNDALEGIEEAIAGVTSVEVTTTDVTLDVTNYTVGVAGHYRNMVIRLTPGTGVGARDIIVPAVEKLYFFHNTTGYTQTVTVSGGTVTAEIDDDQVRFVYCDGTNCYAQTTADAAETGAYTLISTTTISGSTANTSISIAGDYKFHKIVFENITWASDPSYVMLRLSADGVSYASSGYTNQRLSAMGSSSGGTTLTADDDSIDGLLIWTTDGATSPTRYFNAEVTLFGAASATARTAAMAHSVIYAVDGSQEISFFAGGAFYDTARTDTHIRLRGDGSNHTSGKIYVYGGT